MRGEYKLFNAPVVLFMELPPLARGIPVASPVRGSKVGITPACAGNTFDAHNIEAPLRNYPRLRGEYVSRFNIERFHAELPPLARGIQCSVSSAIVKEGITPACAGNTKG